MFACIKLMRFLKLMALPSIFTATLPPGAQITMTATVGLALHIILILVLLEIATSAATAFFWGLLAAAMSGWLASRG